MSDGARNLLVRGIAAAKDNAADDARHDLERVLRIDPSRDQKVKALYWLSKVSSSPEKKRAYLEDAFALDPTHPEARREWAIVTGRLRFDEIVDPDNLPPDASGGEQAAASALQMKCPECGAPLAFLADQQVLACQYCGFRQQVGTKSTTGIGPGERDFIVALATARGHRRPEGTRVFHCSSCGASFVASAETISFSCPYCASTFVEEESDGEGWYQPSGIIPFQVSKEAAREAAQRWIRAKYGAGYRLTEPVAGVYYPAWTFDLGGEAEWHVETGAGEVDEAESGRTYVTEDDVLVPAGQPPSAWLTLNRRWFDLDGLVPYDVRYLADWPTETYQTSVADASLVARKQALVRVRDRISTELSHPYSSRVLHVSAANIAVESFKLILLPLWLGHYADRGKSHSVVVNGQTGQVCGKKPARGARRLWDWLMGTTAE